LPAGLFVGLMRYVFFRTSKDVHRLLAGLVPRLFIDAQSLAARVLACLRSPPPFYIAPPPQWPRSHPPDVFLSPDFDSLRPLPPSPPRLKYGSKATRRFSFFCFFLSHHPGLSLLGAGRLLFTSPPSVARCGFRPRSQASFKTYLANALTRHFHSSLFYIFALRSTVPPSSYLPSPIGLPFPPQVLGFLVISFFRTLSDISPDLQ